MVWYPGVQDREEREEEPSKGGARGGDGRRHAHRLRRAQGRL